MEQQDRIVYCPRIFRAWLGALLLLGWLLAACGGEQSGLAANGTPVATATGSTALHALTVATPTDTAVPPRAAPPTSSMSAVVATPATPAATDAPADVNPAITTSSSAQGGGGGNNMVRVVNHNDGQLRIRGNLDLNHIPGPTVGPVNLAYATSSCADCQTIAVALQIDLISRTATRIVPQNAAVAVNVQCHHCVTIARALQYVIQVDDPNQVPPDVADLLKEMDRTLNDISHTQGITVTEAESQINAVIAQFSTLAASLDDQRQEDTRDNSPGTPVLPTAAPDTTPAPTSPASPTPSGAPQTPSAPPATVTPTATSPVVTPTQPRPAGTP
jgi:putative peptide zinc metalloprotease protein